MKKDIVAGLGEIGSPILKLFSKKQTVVGYDLDKRLVNETKLKKLQDMQTSFLHIAIPVTSKFDSIYFSYIKNSNQSVLLYIVQLVLEQQNEFKKKWIYL